MEEAIKNFNKQFAWKAKVEHGEKLKGKSTFIVGGMGGSNLATRLALIAKPELDLVIHQDYGLPRLSSKRFEEALCIASSFSGNTEEAIDFAEQALKKNLPLAVIAKGGKLLEFAKKHSLPHVVLPPTTIQPRSGLGFQIVALATLIGNEKLVQELSKLASLLRPSELEDRGEALADTLRTRVPVICSSLRNSAVAYNWKIKFNETGKIPSFYNVFPELNHNEMTGFDVIGTTESLSHKFHFIFLTDSADQPQIQKRMKITKTLYENRGLSVVKVPFQGKTPLERIFSSLLIADWTALHLSRIYGTEAEQVPMVEEFKKLITDNSSPNN